MSNFIVPDPDSVKARSAGPTAGINSHCWISFGGNVGDVKGTFDAALALLSLHPLIELGQRSGIYATAPMGSQAGPVFLNSICGLRTQLSPRELLRVLQAVEDQLGRVRDVRWGPRTLDLDLISHGSEVINESDLTVPHPALTYRRFVLDPLAEIDAGWRHPCFFESAGQMLSRLLRRPLKVELLDVPDEQTKILALQLSPRFPDLRFVSVTGEACDVIPIRLTDCSSARRQTIVDLRHSPGCLLEKLTSAFTVIFDAPQRISDW